MTPDHPAHPIDADLLLETLEACAAVFWGPAGDACRELRESVLPAISGRAEGTGLAAPLAAMQEALRAEGACENLEPEYVALFVNTRGRVSAPLYQSCYEDDGQLMGDATLEMRRRLEEEGLAVSPDRGELPDHLCIELEYLHGLLSRGLAGRDPSALQKAASFAGEVMLPWTERFCAAVDSAEHAFFGRSCELLRSALHVAASL